MPIEHSILGVIASRPCTGYDIKTEFEHEGAGMVWGISFGSVYPKLKSLEEQGLIQTYRTETEGRQKKMYELTKDGWEALRKWLGESPSYPVIKDELLLKLSMWDRGRLEDRQTLIEHMKKRKEQSQELLDYYLQWPQNGYSSISEFSMLGIQYVQEKLVTELRWIEKTIIQLEGEPQPPVQDPFDLIPKQQERRNQALNQQSITDYSNSFVQKEDV